MTAKAFILIETAVGHTRAVLATLSKLEGVKSVNAVSGPYDIIASVEKETLTDIGEIVTSEVNSVDGVTRTISCLVG